MQESSFHSCPPTKHTSQSVHREITKRTQHAQTEAGKQNFALTNEHFLCNTCTPSLQTLASCYPIVTKWKY